MPGTYDQSDDETSVEYRPARRRLWAVVTLVGVCVVMSVGGVALTGVVRSPAEAATETGPPAADVLTAAVERRVLVDTVVTRGQVAAAQSLDVTVAGTGGKDTVKTVVTKLPVKVGDSLKAGQVLAEISGRPLFALPGKVPVYRDLRPGSSGHDVQQLQEALKTVGYPVKGDAAGKFGAGTKAAVSSFYRSLGYDPLPAQEGGEDGCES